MSQLEVEADRFGKGSVQHSFELAHEAVEIDGGKPRFGLARGGKKLLDESSAALDGLLDDFDRAGAFARLQVGTLQLVGVAEDDGRDVVEVVRDPAREGAETFHCMCL